MNRALKSATRMRVLRAETGDPVHIPDRLLSAKQECRGRRPSRYD
jgi:hypothetical protein